MKSLPVNLAARPIEGVRIARRWALALIALCGLVTLAHAAVGAGSLASSPEPGSDADWLEGMPVQEWEERIGIYTSLVERTTPDDLVLTAELAEELVTWRAFPWSAVLTDLERALPDNARLTMVQPRPDRDGQLVVQIAAEARNDNPLNLFVRAAEQLPTVADILPVFRERTEDGRVVFVLDLLYRVEHLADEAKPSGSP